jgi:hypothetical protein
VLCRAIGTLTGPIATFRNLAEGQLPRGCSVDGIFEDGICRIASGIHIAAEAPATSGSSGDATCYADGSTSGRLPEDLAKGRGSSATSYVSSSTADRLGREID